MCLSNRSIPNPLFHFRAFPNKLFPFFLTQMSSIFVQKCSSIFPPILFRSLFTQSANARHQFVQELASELAQIQSAGTFKSERIISSAQGTEINLQDGEKPLLNFCANNYLGLSSHPALIQAAKNCLDSHGAGLSSVRFICGTQDIHRRLEQSIARFHGRPDAILYAACFDANAGLFEVIAGEGDAILSDELNHASIIDGIRLSKAKRMRYRHLDMEDLERQLTETKDCRRRIIATDGVFSMDGDLAPLRDIFFLADKYRAIVFVDDCHATGLVGPTGRGTEEHFGLIGRTEIINSTLGKTLGGAMGGYTTGPVELVQMLRQRARPYLFSNSLAPPVVGSALKVMELLSREDNPFLEALAKNVAHFRRGMANAGFHLLGNAAHPICPILLGEAKLAKEFAEQMLKEGIYVIGFSFPVVPKGKARIRVQISASHSREQIEKCIEAFKRVGQRMGVI